MSTKVENYIAVCVSHTHMGEPVLKMRKYRNYENEDGNSVDKSYSNWYSVRHSDFAYAIIYALLNGKEIEVRRGQYTDREIWINIDGIEKKE